MSHQSIPITADCTKFDEVSKVINMTIENFRLQTSKQLFSAQKLWQNTYWTEKWQNTYRISSLVRGHLFWSVFAHFAKLMEFLTLPIHICSLFRALGFIFTSSIIPLSPSKWNKQLDVCYFNFYDLWKNCIHCDLILIKLPLLSGFSGNPMFFTETISYFLFLKILLPSRKKYDDKRYKKIQKKRRCYAF